MAVKGAEAETVDAKDEEGPSKSVPGNPELWKVGGESWLVYVTKDTNGNPIRVAWKAPQESDVESFFGPGQEVTYTKTIGSMPNDVLDFGSTDELANMTDDPITTWRNTLETESKTQPWLLDADYQSMSLMAVLEGRPLSESEIQQTEFWKTHTDAQRQWMQTYNSDPMTAKQMIADQEISTRKMLADAGIDGATDSMVSYLAGQLTMGEWSQTYYTEQIRGLSDPAAGITLDKGLSDVIGDDELGTTQSGEMEVRALVKKWLGPTYGEWDDDLIAEWAGKFRNDPDAETNLVESLKDQKTAMFPGYQREADYQTIAQPWKGFVSQMWGEQIDETDPLFTEIINMNNSGEAGQLLTQKGLERGNDTVVNNVQAALNQSFGGTAR